MSTKLFSELGVAPDLLKAIDRLGFEQASPIQAEAIPVLLSGRDVVGQSQTGSGKTAAFAVPAIQMVDPLVRTVQILILCPTRELAVQVSEEVHKLALFKRGIHALPIYGGQSYERQFYGLREGAQIVIGTPGRVMDHMRRGTLKLDQIKMVILDEADVMLNMGFRDDIEFILQATPPARQTVFFSATMPRPIQELIRKYARDPVDVHIDQKTVTVPTVEQTYYEVDRRFKVELLTRLIDIHDLKLGIVFCNTKRMVDDLTDHLNAQGYSADRLHGDMSQGMRDRVMNKFRKSGLEFLVATDVAARGIDVDDVQVVFNYDLPYDVEDYVHRIGRTGRAGREGRAISFVGGREVFQIYNIERYTKTKVHRSKIPTSTEVEQARAGAFLDKVRTILKAGEYKRHEGLVEILLEEGFNSTDIAAALIHQLQGEQAQPAPEPREDREDDRSRGRDDGRGERTGRGRESAPREREGFARREEGERPRGAWNDRPPRDRDRGERRYPDAPVRRAVTPRPAPAAPAQIRSTAAPVPGVPAAPAPAAPKASESKPAVSTPSIPRIEEKKKTPAKPVTSRADAPEASTTAIAPAKPEAKPAEKFPIAKRETPAPDRSAKHSRRTPENQTRLYFNVGQEMGVRKEDIARSIQGETALPNAVIGEIDLRERHAFVDVSAEHAQTVIGKMTRALINGRKVKVKLA